MNFMRTLSAPFLFAILSSNLIATASETPPDQKDTDRQVVPDQELQQRPSDGLEISTLDTGYDHCHFNEEHGHKHCYDAGEHDFHAKPAAVTRSYVDDRYERGTRRSTRYSQTRRRYSDYSRRSYSNRSYSNRSYSRYDNNSAALNSIALGLAIGLPLAASHRYNDNYYGHNYYGNQYHNRRQYYGYGNHRYGYGNHYPNRRHRRGHGGH